MGGPGPEGAEGEAAKVDAGDVELGVLGEGGREEEVGRDLTLLESGKARKKRQNYAHAHTTLSLTTSLSLSLSLSLPRTFNTVS